MDANTDNLLNQVNLICQKHDEIARITGEHFNIFQTLGLQTDELSHSRIIAEFLNPRGSHGRGGVFLKLFLAQTVELGHDPKPEGGEAQKQREECAQRLEAYAQNQGLENTRVVTEKTTESGRTDIVIFGGQATIVIENKINAGDGEGQLARYREDFPDATIIYLTLYGRLPSDYSTGGDKGAYDLSISYQKHIVNWLEQCKENSANFSYVRETIAQYINLLKSLTGQSRRHEMTGEIGETVARSLENLKSAVTIVKSMDDIKRKILRTHVIPVLEALATELHLELTYDCPDNERYWARGFKNELLQRHGMHIHFRFNEKYFDGWFVGICYHSWKTFSGKNELLDFIKVCANECGRIQDGKMWPYGLSERYGNGDVLADLAGVKLLKEKSIVERGVDEIRYLFGKIQAFEKSKQANNG